MKNTPDNPIRVKSINTENARYLSVSMPTKPISKSEYYTVLSIDLQNTLLELKSQNKVERYKLKKVQYKDEAGMRDRLNGKKIILYFIDDVDFLYGSISAFAQ